MHECTQSCLTLLQPRELYVAHQVPLSREFSRQEYWSRLPIPTPGDLSDSGIQVSLASPALAGRVFTTGSPYIQLIDCICQLPLQLGVACALGVAQRVVSHHGASQRDIRPEPSSLHLRPSMLLSLCLSASGKRHDLGSHGWGCWSHRWDGWSLCS